MVQWPLQDAKNRFSAVVDAALAGDPQQVTRRGKPAVVVLAVDEYERLCHMEKAAAPGFADLLVAATAFEHGLTVVTRNVRHFRPTGVAVVDPSAATD